MHLTASVTPETLKDYKGPCWSLSYTLPFSLFETLYGSRPNPGDTLRANFQKCGDKTQETHFGSWNPIRLSNPDFHRPEFFGYLILEKA
jgi:hypothetical protein